MKILLVGMMAVLVLMGAGCANSLPLVGGSDTVEGKWRLAFNLPEGWAMLKDYDEPINKEIVPSEDVTRDLSDIIVQSTSKAIVGGGIKPDSDIGTDTYVSSGFAKIHVFRLDERRIVPSEANDLGEGWYSVKLCEEGEDCTIYGQYNYDYYLVTESGAKYKFNITTNDFDVQSAIDVIMSAKEVTDFTDAPSVSGTVEATND